MSAYAKIALATVTLLLLSIAGCATRNASPDAPAPTATAAAAPPTATVVENQIDCSPETLAPYLAAQESVTARWDDAFTLADSTARIALSPVVASLQSLRQEAVALTPPQCAAYLQELQNLYMSYAVDGFLLFMQNAESSLQNMERRTPDERFAMHSMARSAYDTYLAALHSDPLAAYTQMHQTQTMVDGFKDDPAWQTIQIEGSHPLTFYIPPGWSNPPSDDPRITRIATPGGDMELKILRDEQNAALAAASPQATQFYAEEELLLDGMRPAIFAKFGENVGPLYRLRTADGSLTQLSGALTLPDNSKLTFDANKPVTPFTEEEVNQIYNILASFRHNLQEQ